MRQGNSLSQQGTSPQAEDSGIQSPIGDYAADYVTRLRRAQDASCIHLFEIGPDQVARCDDGLRALFGLASGARFDHAVWLSCLHPGDRERMQADFERMVREGGATDIEYRVCCSDGTIRWLLTRARSAATIDRPGSIFGATLDITERVANRNRLRESQRALEGSEARLRGVLESTTDSVFTLSADWRFTFLNRHAVAQISDGRNLLGQVVWDAFPEAVGSLLWQAYHRCIAERVATEAEEFYQPLGRLFAARAFPAEDGGITVFFRDVTEQRKAEAIIARSKAELEMLVDERTRDLRETQAKLAHAQRMEALGQLAGGIAHDVNNVLQATLGAAALIDRRMDDPKEVRHLVSMIAEAAERGASITRRLLTFSRRGELRAEPLDSLALLASMREILSSTLGTGVEIKVEADADLPPLLADKGQLETVLVNLATNARDAMANETGTISLTAGSETRTVGDDPAHPAALGAGTYVRLAVSDTGCGMDAGTLARAFEPFFTTKAPSKGTGLGLAMVRSFLEQSGGGMRLESAPGRGTTATLWLPVANERIAPVVAPQQLPDPLGPGASRVLLVDDEELVRKVLAQHLTDRGYTVVEAPEGIAALALLDAGEPIDALVSDLSMPLMNGVALIREARRRRPGLPALLLTGFATEAAELEAYGGGDGGFSLLRKPITGADLAAEVAALLSTPLEASQGQDKL